MTPLPISGIPQWLRWGTRDNFIPSGEKVRYVVQGHVMLNEPVYSRDMCSPIKDALLSIL
jgi:hypothetical protein